MVKAVLGLDLGFSDGRDLLCLMPGRELGRLAVVHGPASVARWRALVCLCYLASSGLHGLCKCTTGEASGNAERRPRLPAPGRFHDAASCLALAPTT